MSERTDPYADEDYDETREEYEETYGETDGETDGSWLDEGIITLLVVVGIVLFLIPEPGTSTLGLLLIGIGVVAWVADMFTGAM